VSEPSHTGKKTGKKMVKCPRRGHLPSAFKWGLTGVVAPMLRRMPKKLGAMKGRCGKRCEARGVEDAEDAAYALYDLAKSSFRMTPECCNCECDPICQLAIFADKYARFIM
jgi:hypothetical protein